MTIYVLIREDQNDHGFVDAPVVGLFRNQKDADAALRTSEAESRAEGLLVCGDPGAEPDWEVYWKDEPHSLA
jgi:hypothetical protein